MPVQDIVSRLPAIVLVILAFGGGLASQLVAAPPAWLHRSILDTALPAPAAYWSRERDGFELWPASSIDDQQLLRLGFVLQGLPVTRLELQAAEVTGTGLKALARLVSLRQMSIPASIPSVELRQLAPLRNLRSLSFAASQIDEPFTEAIEQLARQTSLQELRVTFSNLPADELRPVITRLAATRLRIHLDATGYPAAKELLRACLLVPNIVELSLVTAEIDDRDMFYVARIPSLRTLDLTGTSITAWGLRSLTNLQQLRLLYLPQLGSAVPLDPLLQMPQLRGIYGLNGEAPLLPELTHALPLRRLGSRYSNLTDAGLAELNLADSIEHLSLDGTSLTDAAAASFRGMRQLRTISLSGTAVGDEVAGALGQCDALEEVYLSDTKLTDHGLADLLQAPRLRRLYIDGTAVTAASLNRIAAARSLERLSVNRTEITLAEIGQLRRRQPGLRICNENGQPE